MRKASEIITALFKDRFDPEFMENARSGAGLFSSWTRIVTEVWPQSIDGGRNGDDVPAAAVHSRIGEFERGLLFVEADHPGWIQILQTRQKELLASVQRRYPKLDVKGIVFKLSREPFSSSAAVNSVEGYAEIPEKASAPDTPERKPETVKMEAVRKPRRGQNPADDEFYAALRSLEESVKKRNKMV